MYINLLKQLIKIYHHIGGLENWNFTQSLTFYIYHHIGGLEKVTAYRSIYFLSHLCGGKYKAGRKQNSDTFLANRRHLPPHRWLRKK
jgi:hypothetical protein